MRCFLPLLEGRIVGHRMFAQPPEDLQTAVGLVFGRNSAVIAFGDDSH